MDELLEIKDDLKKFEKQAFGLSFMYRRLPDCFVQIDYDELMDRIKYLLGFIDCMIEFGIKLKPLE